LTPFGELIDLMQDASYAAGVKSGKIAFDVPAMRSIITGLEDQLTDIGNAKSAARGRVGGMSQSEMQTGRSGVTLAGRWLVGTAVTASPQVSFQDNLDELEKLIQYLHDQLATVVDAYAAADTAAREDLDRAIAATLTDERSQTTGESGP
jgi:hypothetical protein